MIVLGLLLGLIIILQIFVLIGTCRTNYKLHELEDLCLTENTNVVNIGLISENMKRMTNVLNRMADALIEMVDKQKKHKKKKGGTFYADNEPES